MVEGVDFQEHKVWYVDVEIAGIIFTTRVDNEGIALKVVLDTAKQLGIAGEAG